MKTGNNADTFISLFDSPVVGFKNNIGRDFAGAQKSCFVKVEYFFVSYGIEILHKI
jgi:hypothetical protein